MWENLAILGINHWVFIKFFNILLFAGLSLIFFACFYNLEQLFRKSYRSGFFALLLFIVAILIAQISKAAMAP